MARPQIAEVVPLLTTRAVEGPFDYRLPPALREAVGVGSLLRVPFARREVPGLVVGLRQQSAVPPERLREPVGALGLALPEELLLLAAWVANYYCSTYARALSLMLPPGASRFRRARKLQPETATAAVPNPGPPPLTEEQLACLDRLERALGSGSFAHLLLHGVTGAGKTELYLRAAERALAQGKGVIVLVPEISLTPQMAHRFRDRFGSLVAVVHSGLSPAQRLQCWLRLRAGLARVCVGPRSAVFAPVERLGLVVVDEEHDQSYKHEGDPRYDARRVAAKRASLAGALLLSGSATPRAETFAAASRLRMARRIDGSPLPPVEVLDMRGVEGPLHPRAVEALGALARDGGKGVVLLNRRGFSLFLRCSLCGHVWGCPHCDVTLVLHRARRELRCHHCGYAIALPARCRCGSRSLARHGFGTERLEEVLAGLLGTRLALFRLDSDAVEGGRGGGEILDRFRAAPAGLLLGTQLVAKGHDFPGLKLGLVVDADATLRFPDFRAEERTFSLITQLAGRVGRGGTGRVLVQTVRPEARALRHAAAHDAEGFLQAELGRRAALSYPPAAELVRVVFGAARPGAAAEAAQRFREALCPRLGADVLLLGPAELLRLRGAFRQALLLKAPTAAQVVGAVRETVGERQASLARAGVSIVVDVDPH